jgi:DNA-binding XRE family transcriptional regulator
MRKTKVKLKNNVQKYRVWKNLQQKELAKEVNISVSEIRMIEKHIVKRPRLDLRLRICEFFGVSHDQMFYEDNEEVFS